MADKPICKIDGCGKRVVAWEMCDPHYRAWRRSGNQAVRVRRGGICKVAGCDNPATVRGMCNPHYKRLLRYGDPLGGGTALGDPLNYLEAVVMTHDGNDCLDWPYAKSAGYAVTTLDQKRVYVSRYVCMRTHGAPPTQAHEAAHSCGNGRHGCVNRNHISWKTGAENQADRIPHGTSNRGSRHGMSKLTEQQVREVRSLVGTISLAAIAKKFGISRSHTSNIASRKEWSHVE